MISAMIRPASQPPPAPEAQTAAIVEHLRKAILCAPDGGERFHAIFLDEDHRFLAEAGLGQGGSAFLSVRMRDLFSRALALGARAIIVAHNHPSGNCRPSTRDISSTHRLVEVGKALDIELIDHLIITHSSVYSMRAGGNL